MFDAPDHTTKIIKNHIGADCLACSYTDEDEQFVQAINYASINGTEIILASKIAKDINRIPPDYIVRPTEKIMDINPKIGLVISADLHLLGQLGPGDWLEFDVCDRPAARQALFDLENMMVSF